MNLFCWNHSEPWSWRGSWHDARLVFQEYTPSDAAEVFWGRRGGRGGTEAPAGDTEEAPLLASSVVAPSAPDVANGEGEEDPDKNKANDTVRKKTKLSQYVDAAVEKKALDVYVPMVQLLLQAALETPSVRGDFRRFIENHQTFQRGQSQAWQWNLDFCKDVLHLDMARYGNKAGFEARCVGYALQRVLNEAIKTRTQQTHGYPAFDERGALNPHTRMDGYMGAYTVSVLTMYFNDLAYKDKLHDWEPMGITVLKDAQGNQDNGLYVGAMHHLGANAFILKPEDLPAEHAEHLPANYQQNLDIYLTYLKRRFGNVDQVLDTQNSVFRSSFAKMIRYVNSQRVAISLEAAIAGASLSPQEKDAVWPEGRLQEKLASAPGPSAASPAVAPAAAPKPTGRSQPASPEAGTEFVRVNFSIFADTVRDFYNTSHYHNLWNLEHGREADAGAGLVTNFLEENNYANSGVQKAYERYTQAIQRLNRAKPADRPGILDEINNTILPALRLAVDEQKNQALARIRYWETPGRVPPQPAWQGKKGEYSIQDARGAVADLLPERMIYGYETNPILKRIYGLLTNSKRDLAFRDPQELQASCKPDLFAALQNDLERQGYLAIGRTPNEMAARDQKLVNLVNAAIWIRNLNALAMERGQHFLRSPEQYIRKKPKSAPAEAPRVA